MNLTQNMIIANGRIITPKVKSCKYNKGTQKWDVTFTEGKTYSYNYNNVSWLKDPKVLNPQEYQIATKERELFKISAIYVFKDSYHEYWHICFEDGSFRDYHKDDLIVKISCLSNVEAANVFDYLNKTAALVSIETEDGTKLLSKQYEKMTFAGEETALACYLNPHTYKPRSYTDATPIFPFGCNASQFKAVKAALENQISIIQGPPGTGKTQTILNIIANLLVAGKTVQVVSNNNSAIENVLEKLASSKYEMDFLVAPLGNSKNKIKFIKNQTGFYPDISLWESENVDRAVVLEKVKNGSNSLSDIFSKQERLAVAKLELKELQLELKYFNEYYNETNNFQSLVEVRKNISSEKLLNLWQECQHLADVGKEPTFLFKLLGLFKYGIKDFSFYNQDITKIIATFQKLFYIRKENELTEEIRTLETSLENVKAKEKSEEFTKLSMTYLKDILFNRYGNISQRQLFTEKDFYKNYSEIQKEYPIVLSTAFSSRSSLCKDAQFDYLIMDEASQVDVATGALALSCAKNVVIVGDTKQLPNVVSPDMQKKTDAIFESYNITKSYSFAHKSFLQSVSEIIPSAPQTLLREHYRCHPKIINFCNKKFYDNELVIMTTDNDEKDVLSVVKTAEGNHTRGHLNQRQIDVVKNEVLPKMNFSNDEVGIIAPYNDQVDAMIDTIQNHNIAIATVHKFQGREKDAIILTTVDNRVTDFSDNPYLLNVAISRTKKELTLVVSGNEQPTDSNIGDLISYIEYNNFEITESKTYSVFDYLYKPYTESRFEYLKKHKRISEYDSENLMYGLICDTLKEMSLTYLDVICHQPLNMLIRDPKYLNDDECKYAMNNATHLDFLIYNKISKKPVLAVEVDGYNYHKAGTEQAERDIKKNHILDIYGIPYIRFATNGSGEKEKLIEKINEALNKTFIK